MDAVEGPTGPVGLLVNIGLGVVFTLGVAFTAYMLIASWGESYWIYTTAVAVTMSALALLRERQRLWTAVAGVAVAGVAVAVSLEADLPQEPSPVAALALAVLVGSSIRRLPARLSVPIAAGGVGVIALTWTAGLNGVTVLATVLVVGGLVVGPLLRVFARGRSGALSVDSALAHGRQQ